MPNQSQSNKNKTRTLTPSRKTIVGLGELLFDIIDDQPILGGAPVNFAIQAHQVLFQYGYQGVPAVRLGNDCLARQAITQLQSFGLNTDFVQYDARHPTGTAIVHRESVGHRFEIVENVCWDHFQWDDQLELLSRSAAVVCFGTLGQRSEFGRSTIQQFVESAEQAIRIFDVNLRQHYYNADIIKHGCHHANLLKLNDDELIPVCQSLGISPADTPTHSCQQILAETPLEYIVFTQGALGTTMITTDIVQTGAPVEFPPAPNADSVGAGDACTAGIIAGLLLELPLEAIVNLANRLGAYVASKPGATPTLPANLLTLQS